MNHRESWAKEMTSPSKAEYLLELRSETSGTGASTPRAPVRKVVGVGASQTGSLSTKQPASDTSPALRASKISADTLVVVSKVKQLIKEQSGMNTSQCCVDRLTRKVVEECLKGIERAKEDERKTVMGRDIY